MNYSYDLSNESELDFKSEDFVEADFNDSSDSCSEDDAMEENNYIVTKQGITWKSFTKPRIERCRQACIFKVNADVAKNV